LADISPAINDIGAAIQKDFANIKVTCHVCDATKSSDIEKLFKDIREMHPDHFCPTVLVNSAGIGIPSPLLEVTEQVYDQVINVNLKGTFLVTQTLIKLLVENYPKHKFQTETDSYASIINFGSMAGQWGAAGMSPYSITKSGLEGFTRSVSRESGSYRIRCNVVLPYFIETPMANQVITGEKSQIYKNKPDLKRFGKADEVAQLVYFLATDASSYITGANIDINGGC
jgi:17beta-estradiol 17-dehydrogenase/3alpha(17beta)-hydroxysteroid dehydrogenase (NAD+)